MSLLAQIIAYIVSPLATLLAVWIAYLAVLRGSQPQLLVYYQPNPDVPSLIDLVVENIGGGSAIGVAFSEHLPIGCFGIERPDGDGALVPKTGFHRYLLGNDTCSMEVSMRASKVSSDQGCQSRFYISSGTHLAFLEAAAKH